jgi:hypothetical protein
VSVLASQQSRGIYSGAPMVQRFLGRSRGNGFVKFKEKEGADTCLERTADATLVCSSSTCPAAPAPTAPACVQWSSLTCPPVPTVGCV